MKFLILFCLISSTAFGVGPNIVSKKGSQVRSLADAEAYGLVTKETEGVFTPTLPTFINMAGTPAITSGSYYRVGNMVLANFIMTGMTSITLANERTGITVNLPVGLPMHVNISPLMGGTSSLSRSINPRRDVPFICNDASGSDSLTIFCTGNFPWTGPSSNSMNFSLFYRTAN